MDNNATGTATQSLKFINHRGFVRKVRVDQNSGSDTLNAASGESFRDSTQVSQQQIQMFKST